MRASTVLLPAKRGGRPWHLVVLGQLFRDPSLLIAALLTCIELGGQPVPWYWMVGVTFVNLLCVRSIAWVLTMSLLYCVLSLHKAGRRWIFRRLANAFHLLVLSFCYRQEGVATMSDKQEGEIVANPVASEQLLSHLLYAGEALQGETHGVFDRLAQEMALITHGQVQLVLHQENAEQSPPPLSRFRSLIFFNNRFYGALLIEPDPANPVSPVIPLETVTMLTQACGWLLYSLEVAALLPELRQPYALTDKARTSLPKRAADILALTCQGYTTRQIATTLHITPATVRKYRERLYRWLNVHSEGEAVFAAFATGLFYPVAGLRPQIVAPTNGH